MKKTFILSFLICVLNTILYSQDKNDTIIFFSKFNLFTSYIEILDSCNGTSIKINSKDGTRSTPKEFIINKNTRELKVIIHFPLFFGKAIDYLKVEEIYKKVIFIWYQKKRMKYQYYDYLPPPIY